MNKILASLTLILSTLTATVAHADYAVDLQPVDFTCTGEDANKQGLIMMIEVDGSQSKVTWALPDEPGYVSGTLKAGLPMLSSEGTLSIAQRGQGYNLNLMGEDTERVERDYNDDRMSGQVYTFTGTVYLNGVTYNLSSCDGGLIPVPNTSGLE